MARPVTSLVVDDELVWIVPLPAVSATAVRPASPQHLAELADLLDAELEAEGQQRFLIQALHHLARAAAASVADLPPLPFIGEPFGGQGGTD